MTFKTTSTKSMKTRVLVISERFYPEHSTINDLTSELQKQGLEFDVLTQVPSYPHGRVSAYPGYRNKLFSVHFWNNIKVYRIMTIEGYHQSKIKKIINYFHFSIFCSLVVLFIGRKYSKIFVFHSGPLTLAMPALIGKKIFKTTNVIWSTDLWPDTVYMYGLKRSKLNELLLDWLVKMIYRQFDTIYCSSFAFEKRLQHYVGTKQIHTLLQWPQISNEKNGVEKIILEPGYFHFTFAGNIAWTQNLENVILGFSLVRKNDFNIKLNVFGVGSDLERLKKIVSEKNIENIYFGGWKPLTEMSAIYNQSHVLVISLQPNPVYELYIPLKFSTYLAYNKPVFAIMNGAVNDITKVNKIGIIASPSSPEEICKGFENLRSMDQQELYQYGQNSAVLLENQFSREKNINVLFNELKP